MATEIEIKLRVPDEVTLDRVLADPGLTQYMRDEFVSKKFHSIYFDTEDGELSARRWTLRLRKEGSQSVAALKTANSFDGEMFTRNEWQCLADSIEEAIPALMNLGAPKELAKLLESSNLVEVCGAEFERRSNFLYLDDGIRIELCGDVGTLYAGGKRLPIIEVELELLFGDSTVLPHICHQLMDDYGLEIEKLSKNARANALRDDIKE